MGLEVTENDSLLGSWTTARWRPDRGHVLDGSVAQIWFFDGRLAAMRERVFPRGICELIVQLDEPHRRPGGDRFPPLVFDGLQTHAGVVEAPSGRCRVIGVQFEPLGANAVLGRPLHDTANDGIALEELTGRDAAHRLHDACLRARGPAAVVAAVVAWCAGRVVRAIEADPAVVSVVRQLRGARGNAAIAAVLAGSGRSERKAARAFREAVGVGPKRYARLLRFARAHALVSDASIDLADVAARAGFYDQAHLTTDFREHAGMSPATYRARPRYPGSLSLPE